MQELDPNEIRKTMQDTDKKDIAHRDQKICRIKVRRMGQHREQKDSVGYRSTGQEHAGQR